MLDVLSKNQLLLWNGLLVPTVYWKKITPSPSPSVDNKKRLTGLWVKISVCVFLHTIWPYVTLTLLFHRDKFSLHWQNFQMTTCVYEFLLIMHKYGCNIGIWDHLQILEAYSTNLWPIGWWSTTFNKYRSFTWNPWVL